MSMGKYVIMNVVVAKKMGEGESKNRHLTHLSSLGEVYFKNEGDENAE